MSFLRLIKASIKRLKRNNVKDEGSFDYIQLVSEQAGWSYDEAKKQMDIVRSQLGIPYDIYYRKKYYEVSRSRQERRAATYRRYKESEAKTLNSIAEKTGRTPTAVIASINELNNQSQSKYKINLIKYNKYGMYDMPQKEALELMDLLGRVRKQTASIQSLLEKIDSEEMEYSEIEKKIKRYYALTKKTITPALRRRLSGTAAIVDKTVLSDSARFDDMITDIEVSRNLLGFTLSEYKMYHLYDASFEKKREYLNDCDRKKWIRDINSTATFDLVNNKYYLYKKLKTLFGREMLSINSEDDFDVFCDYISRHHTFVCKPLNDSLGRGVALVTIDPEADLKAEFKRLLEEKLTFLMEERVVCDERLSAFNPDSLNTVRFITYYDGEKVYPAGGFFRTGRPGSFVDNAGAGGVFASIDCETGRLNSVGGDENGILYEEHPASHLRYMDFQLPDWQEALEVSTEACRMIGERCFIGWDLALNDKGKWIIIEGNGIPQFLQQGPLGYGLKSEFKRIIGL